MRTLSKKIVIFALGVITLLSAFAFGGCGLNTNDEEKATYTVTFTQNGKTKAEVTVKEGEKVDSKSVPDPDKGSDGLVVEWNYDFDSYATKNLVVDTVSYTEGLNFNKSLKGGNYVVVGYTGAVESVYIPDFYRGGEVISIRAEAFKNNQTLVSVRFPSKLKSVGDEAFKGCVNLRDVALPESVDTLGASAFAECESFTSFIFPPSITIVSSRVVQGCKFDSVTVPEGVTQIESYAFACKITKIVLPVSLKRIEECGIWGELREIFYAGDESRWETVIISSVVYKYDGGEFSAKSITEEIATVYFYSESAPVRSGNFWHYVEGVPTVWD